MPESKKLGQGMSSVNQEPPSTTGQIRVHVGLVHNFGHRFLEAQKAHELVVHSLKKLHFVVTSSAHGPQPAVVRPGILQSLTRKVRDLALKDAYRSQVLNIEPKKRNVRVNARKVLESLKGSERDKMWVDGQITKKHSEVWKDALRNGADFVLVSEDDAIPAEEFALRLDALMKEVMASNPAYVDLAGGFKRELVAGNVGVSRLTKVGPMYTRVVTNTSCSYLMQSRFIEDAIRVLSSLPLSRLIAVDTFVNEVSRHTALDNAAACLHAEPRIFFHGSMNNGLASWR